MKVTSLLGIPGVAIYVVVVVLVFPFHGVVCRPVAMVVLLASVVGGLVVLVVGVP